MPRVAKLVVPNAAETNQKPDVLLVQLTRSQVREDLKEDFRTLLEEYTDPLKKNQPMLSFEEMCEYLNIGTKTLQKLTEQEGLPMFRVGNLRRFDVREVLAYLREKQGANNETKSD